MNSMKGIKMLNFERTYIVSACFSSCKHVCFENVNSKIKNSHEIFDNV